MDVIDGCQGGFGVGCFIGIGCRRLIDFIVDNEVISIRWYKNKIY